MAQQNNNQNKSNGSAVARRKNRRANVLTFLFALCGILYIWDKLKLDTAIVTLFEWFNSNGTGWIDPNMIEGGQGILLFGGMAVAVGVGIFLARQEEA